MTDTNPAPAGPTHSAPGAGRNTFNWWRWFWIGFLFVSLGYAWHSFWVPDNDVAWAADHAAAMNQAAATGQPVLLFVTATWCVPCRIMKREVWADDEVAAAVDGRFVPVMIDADDPAAAELLARYRIGVTPTTLITDAQGAVLQRVQGGVGKDDFLAWLEQQAPTHALR